MIEIFEKITFNTSYIASMLKHRLMGFAPDAFGFHGEGHPTIDSLSQLTPGRYLSSPGPLDRAVIRSGIHRRGSPPAPLSRTALINLYSLTNRQRRGIMHPLKKAARIAGAVYLSMVVTAPFTLLYVPSKLIVRGNAAATANNILAHETMFRLSIFGDLVGPVIFICLGDRALPVAERCQQDLGLVDGGIRFGLGRGWISQYAQQYRRADSVSRRAISFRSSTNRSGRTGYLFIRLHSQGIFINEIFWGLWLFPFGLLVFRSGFLPRFIGVWLMINCFGYVALSVTALFFPDYYEAAFSWAQPVLFGELAIMLWLLIKGAKVPTAPNTLQPATGGLAFR